MARVSDTQDVPDIERGTAPFLLPHSEDQDISAGCGSDRSGSGTDHSSLDPEQPCKPLILEKYIINGNNKVPNQHGLSSDMTTGQHWGAPNGGTMTKPKNRKSVGVKTKLCCLVGGVTFAAGAVLIVIAVLMINNKIISCENNSPKTGSATVSKTVGDNRDTGVSDSHKHSQVVDSHLSTSAGVQEKTNVPFTVTVTTSTTSQPMTFDHLVNLAAGGQAYQSSTFRSEEGTTFPASAAIDGSDNNSIKTGSCSQTNEEQAPVWWIDLGSFQLVKRVRILQPSDCCGGSLGNFEIRIGQQRDLTTNVLCRDYMGTALHAMVDVQCQRQIYGRYVSIQLLSQDNKPRKLTLCEVAIYDG